MATLRNRRKLAVVSRETQEQSWNSQSHNTYVPGIKEQFITQDFEEIEGRVSQKLSQDLSRTDFRIVEAFSQLDESLLSPLVRTLSRTLSGNFCNLMLNTRTTWGLVPERSPSWSGVLCLSGPNETSHVLTGVQEEIPYCAPGTFSGKQKARSTS